MLGEAGQQLAEEVGAGAAQPDVLYTIHVDVIVCMNITYRAAREGLPEGFRM